MPLFVNDDGLVADWGAEPTVLIWENLIEVRVETSDRGPWVDDMTWILRTATHELEIPSEIPGTDDLLRQLQKLPGFDNRQVIAASACTENARFVCWAAPETAPGEKTQ